MQILSFPPSWSCLQPSEMLTSVYLVFVWAWQEPALLISATAAEGELGKNYRLQEFAPLFSSPFPFHCPCKMSQASVCSFCHIPLTSLATGNKEIKTVLNTPGFQIGLLQFYLCETRCCKRKKITLDKLISESQKQEIMLKCDFKNPY